MCTTTPENEPSKVAHAQARSVSLRSATGSNIGALSQVLGLKGSTALILLLLLLLLLLEDVRKKALTTFATAAVHAGCR